jgi:formate dehydrogenase subunit gamma
MPPTERARRSAFSSPFALRTHSPIRSGAGAGSAPSPLQNRRGPVDPVPGSASDTEGSGEAHATTDQSHDIVRFRASERYVHWAIAIPFMICLATAAILVVVYNPHPARPYRALFSWIHRLSGLCLAVLPAWTVIRHRADFSLHFGNARTVWSWTLADLKWLLLIGPSTLSRKVALPDQGKFNAAEKINFMMLTATWPMYVFTGLQIWLPGIAFLSWLIHLSMAAAALPLIFGHIFMATVNPDTRVGLSGMISGRVNREWARHHYRHWYDEHFPSAAPQPVEKLQPVQATQPIQTPQPVQAPRAVNPPIARWTPGATIARDVDEAVSACS